MMVYSILSIKDNSVVIIKLQIFYFNLWIYILKLGMVCFIIFYVFKTNYVLFSYISGSFWGARWTQKWVESPSPEAEPYSSGDHDRLSIHRAWPVSTELPISPQLILYLRVNLATEFSESRLRSGVVLWELGLSEDVPQL